MTFSPPKPHRQVYQRRLAAENLYVEGHQELLGYERPPQTVIIIAATSRLGSGMLPSLTATRWVHRSTELRPDGDINLPAEAADAMKVPGCDKCGGIMKPDVVMFGDNVPTGKASSTEAHGRTGWPATNPKPSRNNPGASPDR